MSFIGTRLIDGLKNQWSSIAAVASGVSKCGKFFLSLPGRLFMPSKPTQKWNMKVSKNFSPSSMCLEFITHIIVAQMKAFIYQQIQQQLERMGITAFSSILGGFFLTLLFTNPLSCIVSTIKQNWMSWAVRSSASPNECACACTCTSGSRLSPNDYAFGSTTAPKKTRSGRIYGYI